MSIDKDMQQGYAELLQRIREAAGDPHGKLMQNELVERIRQMLEDKPSADGPVNPHPAGSEEAEAWDCGYHNKRVRRDGLGAHLAKVWREGWDARALMLEDKPSVQEPSTPENEQRLMQLLSEALGARHPAIDDLARLIFDARKGRTHPPAQAPQQGRMSALVNELVEQGQFYQSGEIDEPTFIRAVNHYVSQLAAPQQGRERCLDCGDEVPKRVCYCQAGCVHVVSQGAQDQEGRNV